MRKILTLILIMATVAGNAQNAAPARVYAFMQPSHPGIVPANRPNATLADYRVFLVYPKEGLFSLKSISIGGKAYSFTTEAIAMPVTQVYRDHPQQPRTEVLVPAGKGIAIQVILKKAPNRPGAGPLKVVYLYNGKSYSKTIKDWKELAPMMNE
jgi:hypothetical protein